MYVHSIAWTYNMEYRKLSELMNNASLKKEANKRVNCGEPLGMIREPDARLF